jgi:multicomponent Na+:H+ antiporter subunit B
VTTVLILAFFVIAIVAALVALQVRDLLAAAALLSVFSFVVALLYISLGAVDVGFNEAVLGAGVTGVFFLVAVYHTTRRTRD